MVLACWNGSLASYVALSKIAENRISGGVVELGAAARSGSLSFVFPCPEGPSTSQKNWANRLQRETGGCLENRNCTMPPHSGSSLGGDPMICFSSDQNVVRHTSPSKEQDLPTLSSGGMDAPTSGVKFPSSMHSRSVRRVKRGRSSLVFTSLDLIDVRNR